MRPADLCAAAAAILAALGGGAALIGWLCESPTLKSGVPGFVPMNPLTAINFLLLAGAIGVSACRWPAKWRAVRRVLAAAVAVSSLSCLVGYITGWEIGLDRAMFGSLDGTNRMAPNTAAHFIFLGLSLLVVDEAAECCRWCSQVLALIVLTGAAMSLVGYAYGAKGLYGVGDYIPMALPTATHLGVAAVGVLALRPQFGVLAIIHSPCAGGLMARWILPAAITVPVILGFLRVCGQRAGYYDTEFGSAAFVVVTVGLLVGVVIVTAARLNRIDTKRRCAECDLRLLNHQLERRVEKRTAELKVRDQQLRQAQKMEAIGRLAGGVAHDFNNLLTIILGYSDALSGDCDMPPQERVQFLDEIRKAAQRAAVLTRQLLAFSRKQLLEPRVISLNDVVSGIEQMLARLIGEDISFRVTLAPRLARVSADPGQIEQVIMNLVINARDAMPQGGELIVETANVELSPSYVETHSEVKPGKYAMLAVSDSGFGMDEATKARIFEPFFTTKEAGKGTGLGLATVYGIVRQSGGHIWVYSEPGQGTTFKIYFPAVETEAADGAGTTPFSQAQRGNETVLLVEDEPGVRALSRSALQKYGYNVLEVASAYEAIEASQSHAGPIDVLVTDVVMPQLNGRRLAELLLAERPEMKVLYVSGYTDDAIVRQGLLGSEVNFLQKPFTSAALAAKVREVLDGVLV